MAIFRYAISAHQISNLSNSGIARTIPGSDFIISLAPISLAPTDNYTSVVFPDPANQTVAKSLPPDLVGGYIYAGLKQNTIPVGAMVTVHGQRNRDPSRYEMKTIQVEYAGKHYNVYPEFVNKVR